MWNLANWPVKFEKNLPQKTAVPYIGHAKMNHNVQMVLLHSAEQMGQLSIDVLQVLAWHVRTMKVLIGYWILFTFALVEALVQQQLITLFTSQWREVNCLHTHRTVKKVK